MDEMPAAGRQYTWVRCITVLIQRIQAVGYTLCARLLKPDAPRRLVHLPRNAVPRPVSTPVAVDLEEQIASRSSGTIYFDVLPQFEDNLSSLPLLSNLESLELGSTVSPGLEQSPPSCSETKNSEFFPEPEANHRFTYPLPKPVHESASTISPGFEKPLSGRAQTTDADVVSQPEIHLSRPPRLKRGSGQLLSSGSESTDSDIVSEPEIIPDVIRLAGTAALVSGAEVERGLGEIMFTKSWFSGSSDSDILPESEGNCDIIHRPRKAVNASSMKPAPKLPVGSSESSTYSDILFDPVESTICVTRREATSSGAEQTETSFSYSDGNTDNSDAVSELNKQKESAAIAANSSTRVLVGEELKPRGKGGQDSEGIAFGKLNPNAKEFHPGASNRGDFLVHSGQQSDLQQRLKVTAEQLTLSWIEGKAYSPASAPCHSTHVELETALRLNVQGVNKWKKWTQARDFVPRSHSEIVWESGSNMASSRNKSGPVQDVKLPSGKQIATPTQRWKVRRADHRLYYYSSPPVRTLKASKDKA